MTEPKWPDPTDYKTFSDYNEAWHRRFKELNPGWRDTMYVDGQLDELPYVAWDECNGPS